VPGCEREAPLWSFDQRWRDFTRPKHLFFGVSRERVGRRLLGGLADPSDNAGDGTAKRPWRTRPAPEASASTLKFCRVRRSLSLGERFTGGAGETLRKVRSNAHHRDGGGDQPVHISSTWLPTTCGEGPRTNQNQAPSDYRARPKRMVLSFREYARAQVERTGTWVDRGKPLATDAGGDTGRTFRTVVTKKSCRGHITTTRVSAEDPR